MQRSIRSLSFLSPSVSLSTITGKLLYMHKCCLTVGRQSRDLRPLSRDRSATFFKKISNCLKRPKNVVWQSADGRVTSDHCRVTVQRLFSKNFLIAWNVQKTLFDSRPTVAWPPTTVAWPFSDFFQNFPKSLETSKKRCLTVGRRSRDLRPLSRDRSATFFKIFPNCLKRLKNVVWQSADGRVTSDHCRVTVQRLFSQNFPNYAWNVQKTLFDSRPTVAWCPTNVAWPFSDFYAKFSQIDFASLKNGTVWQSAVGRVTSDHCRIVQPCSAIYFVHYSSYSSFFPPKALFDVSPPTGIGPILEISTSYQS